MFAPAMQSDQAWQTARKIASLVATFRSAPPVGMEYIQDLPWNQIRSISWRERPTGTPVIAIDLMEHRSLDAPIKRVSTEVADGNSVRIGLEDAVAHARELLRTPFLAEVQVMVGYPGWKVELAPAPGSDVEPIVIESPESLAIRGDEWDEFIIQRDADNYMLGENLERVIDRAAGILERTAKTMTIGYHRHWTSVDAEVLRRLAARHRENA